MQGEVFKDRSKNCTIFKMQLFATVGNSVRPTTDGQYLHVVVVT